MRCQTCDDTGWVCEASAPAKDREMAGSGVSKESS